LLNHGLYEQVISRLLDRLTSQLDPATMTIETEVLDDGDSHAVLAEYMHQVIRSSLAGIHGEERLSRQVELCNQLVNVLARANSAVDIEEAAVADGARRLLAVFRKEPMPIPVLERPDTPLSIGCLLTGTRLDPSLISQLRKEIRSANHIDVLCSFIKWSGIRILEDELRQFTARPEARLRIITTSYLGATDLKAIDFLQSLPNTSLRVSYDTHRTRLHAKAYLFHRETGFGSAYIGSANLSHAALTDGLEWNIKVSQYESPHLWAKVTATFDTYWNDAEFTPYEAEDRQRLEDALEQERLGGADNGQVIPPFDLRPYAFQQEILDQLCAERGIQGRNRHLVVAATGTGKTIISAFDYRQWCRSVGATGVRPRLMFVAHREEILKQSLGTFRAVLRDQNFGDLLVAGNRPGTIEHLFVSIQSYNSQGLWTLAPDYFDYVVVDEFHHAAAPSYERLLTTIRPKVLLGLTATPERADGIDVLKHFDGHISAEIRLPDAINRKLLSPFQYFGVSDAVDLSGLRWQRGGYRIEDLDRVYTGNDARAHLVIEKVREKLLDPRKARGLGFCVSVAHAEFMAAKFRQFGIPAEALSGESPREHRLTVQDRLRRREINFIFVVDLYNEGVDIPEIDTVLFLRPTESLTLFLQQLGRGLRLHDEKDCLTVLDFIGQAHRSYRFDVRYRALLDDPARSVDEQVGQGFSHLPAGCSIQLERMARQYILENIRQALRQTRVSITRELAAFAQNIGRVPTLAEFLDHYKLDIDDIYRRGVSWSRLCVEAGLRPDFHDPNEDLLTQGLRRIQHISSVWQIRRLLELLAPPAPLPVDTELDEPTRRLVLMMLLSLRGPRGLPDTLLDGLQWLRSNPTMAAELRELLSFRLDHAQAVAPAMSLPFVCPLTLHAQYTRDEILAALGHWTLDRRPDMREGVLHLPQIKADLFLVTLNKTERDYSPTTMYEDYAINDRLFHWQSQSTTSADSSTGRRYIEHASRGHTILLCIREHKRINGLSAPYHFVGPVDHESHTGSRPISIVWRLRHPLPARLLRRMARLAVG